MGVLVIAEHDNQGIKDATLNTVTAAIELGAGDVEVLVAGEECKAAAEGAATISGISKVHLVDNVLYAHGLAEPFAALVVSMADVYSHIVFSHTTHGKNVAPRVAALLDIVQISDIVEVKSPDTFIRPIYAGNAMATVQANEEKLVVTVRGTAFEKAELQGNAKIDTANASDDPGLSSFVGQELTRSERPELTSARIVVSGGRGMQSGDNFHLVEAV